MGGTYYLGAIVNDSRALARQLLTFTRADRSLLPEPYQRFTCPQIAFCYALSRWLHKQEVAKVITHQMSEKVLSCIQQYSNLPNAILLQHGVDLHELLD